MRLPPRLLKKRVTNVLACTTFATIAILTSCVTPMVVETDAKAPLLENFGTVAWPITTVKPEAQRLFDQGVLQAYAFNEYEAVRAFKAALAADPGCAMCAFGVAWQLGPNINAPERDSLTEIQRYALLARQNAANLATPVTTRERALIEAMIARYGGVGVQPKAVKVLPSDYCGTRSTRTADPLDVVYAAHMRELVAAYPDDADIASMYAEAVMVATTDDWWNRKTGAAIGQIGVMASHLERVLQKHPNHTGLNHYLIHAMDSSREPERALAAADKLGALAPMSPHLRHMPAHIYVRTARFGDAVRVNQSALASEITLKEQLVNQNFKVVKNWDAHNTHFLWFAALMDGRADTAFDSARRMAKRGAKGDHTWAEYQRSLPLLTLARLQRWEEVLAEPAPKPESRYESAVHGYARAAALASAGKLAEARNAGAPLEALVAELKAKRRLSDDEKFGLPMMETLLAWQQAEIAMAAGDMNAAIAAATRGVEIEDTFESREPPILAAGSRTLLGQIYLKAKRWSDAEKTFRDDLADQPGSGWALRGLTIALTKQDKNTEATAVKATWEKTWADADLAMKRL